MTRISSYAKVDIAGRDDSMLRDFEENGPASKTLQGRPIKELYEEIIADHAKKHPTKSLKIHFIGHSLGGSVASITASQWASMLQIAQKNAELQLTLYQSAPVSQSIINKLDQTCIKANIPLSVINLISSGDIVSMLPGGNWAAIQSEYVQATMSTMPLTGHNQLAFASECEYSTPTNHCHITSFICSPEGYNELNENNFKQPPDF